MLRGRVIYIWWAAAIVYSIAFAAGMAGWLGSPVLGIEAEPLPDGRMSITKIVPGGPVWVASARVGDILLEIDGLEVNEALWDDRGDTGIAFVIQVGGSTINPPTLIEGRQESPISNNGVATILLIISLVFAITSFFVFYRSSHSYEVLILSALLMVFACGFAISPAAARWLQWPLLALYNLAVWSSALFLLFFSLFPRGRLPNGPVAIASVYVMLAWATALTVLFALSYTVVPELYGPIRRFSLVYAAGGFLGGFVYLLVAFFTSKTLVPREQSRVMLVGIAAAILPFVSLTIIPQIVGLTPYIRPEITALGIIFIPLSFAYAILRHQLMEIRRLVHRGAAYALISFSVLIFYGLLIALIRVVGGSEVSESTELQIVLMVLLFAVLPFMVGTRRLVYATVDRLLYREFLDHPGLTSRLSVNAATAQSIDDLARNVLGAITRELRLSFATLVGTSPTSSNFNAAVGTVPEEVNTRVAVLASEQSDTTVTYLELSSAGIGERALLVELPRCSGGTRVLCFGPKITEEPFSKDDVEFAQSIAGQLATVTEKLELLQELQTKAVELKELNQRLVETEEAERFRIALYLHDEPLQEISNLIWNHSGIGISHEAAADLRRISENLRGFTARLQPAVVADLGLVRALEWLGHETSAISQFEFAFDPGTIQRDERLDRSIEIGLYRIAQEALSNCQRHANATNVWVNLSRDDSEIALVVEDDGVGFSPAHPTEAGQRLGLIGMRERAEQLGGQLEVHPRQPHGSRVVAVLPVKSPDRDGTSRRGTES